MVVWVFGRVAVGAEEAGDTKIATVCYFHLAFHLVALEQALDCDPPAKDVATIREDLERAKRKMAEESSSR